MTYTLTLDGYALHHYGRGVYGWGRLAPRLASRGGWSNGQNVRTPKNGQQLSAFSAPGPSWSRQKNGAGLNLNSV